MAEANTAINALPINRIRQKQRIKYTRRYEINNWDRKQDG